MKRPEALAAKCLPGVFKKIVKFIGAKLWYNKGRERGAAHGAAFPCLKCRLGVCLRGPRYHRKGLVIGMENHKILIVEDDAAIAGAITRILESWGMASRCVRDFRDVLREFTEYDPHLVLMDVTLPFFNGYHWCSEIRKISAVPVLFVSSAAENMNIVMAVDMGGDDFFAKPFDPSVLMAKIRALLRRTYDLGDRVPVIEHRGAVLNLNDGTLLCGGEKTELTRNEFRILQTLLESRGKVVSRETLMTRLWEYDLYVEENTLTVNVTRLRKKLAAVGLTDYIATRVGSGYIIE